MEEFPVRVDISISRCELTPALISTRLRSKTEITPVVPLLPNKRYIKHTAKETCTRYDSGKENTNITLLLKISKCKCPRADRMKWINVRDRYSTYHTV